MTERSAAALRWYGEALLTGTTEEVRAADAEVDAATRAESLHDRLARRIGLEVGEEKQVEFQGRTWTMRRTQ